MLLVINNNIKKIFNSKKDFYFNNDFHFYFTLTSFVSIDKLEMKGNLNRIGYN